MVLRLVLRDSLISYKHGAMHLRGCVLWYAVTFGSGPDVNEGMLVAGVEGETEGPL